MSSPRRNTNESKSSSILKPATKPEANNSQKMENSTLLNNDVLSTFYTKDENSFLKKISKFNMNFFILSDKYLKMKTDLDKMNDNIYLNLFKQINAYIEEIERLNLKLREKGENSKLKIENITELNKEILNQKNTIRTLEKQISDKINNEIKLKNEINSYKRQVTFYKDKLKIQLQNRSIAKERAAEKENNTNTSINNTSINNSTNERNPSKESKDQKEKEIFRSGSSSNLKKKYLNKTLELTIDSDEEKEKSIIANTNTNNNNNNVSNSTNNTPSSKKSIKFSSFKNVKGQTGSMTTSQLRKFVPSTLSRTQIGNPNQIKKTLYEKGKLKKNLNSAHQKGNKAGNMSFVEEDIFTNKFSIKDELNKTVSAIKMDAFSPKKEIEEKKKIKKTYHKTYTLKNAKLNNNNNNSKILKTNNNVNNNNTNNNHQVQINIGSINNNNYTLGKNSITENMKKTMKDINDDYEKHLEVLNKEEEEIKKLLELMNVKIDLPNIVNKNNNNNEKLQNISILSINSSQNSRKVSENNKTEEEKKENDKKNEEKKENDNKNEEKKENDNKKNEENNNNKEEIKKENDNNSKVNNNDKK
jgi:hypothetical protein